MVESSRVLTHYLLQGDGQAPSAAGPRVWSLCMFLQLSVCVCRGLSCPPTTLTRMGEQFVHRAPTCSLGSQLHSELGTGGQGPSPPSWHTEQTPLSALPQASSPGPRGQAGSICPAVLGPSVLPCRPTDRGRCSACTFHLLSSHPSLESSRITFAFFSPCKKLISLTTV